MGRELSIDLESFSDVDLIKCGVCLGALKTRSPMFLIPKNDLKAYLGGNLEGKLADAYRILEAETSGEK